MMEVHRINLMEALAAVEAHAETRFSLSFYRGTGRYGLAFCIAGIVAYLPHFQAQGVYAHPVHGGPALTGPGGALMDPRRTLEHLFGPFARDDLALFALYGQGAWDVELFLRLATMPTHKDLALMRFRHVLDLVSAELREQTPRAVPTAGAGRLAA